MKFTVPLRVAAGIIGCAALGTPAHALSALNGTYFKMAENDPDANVGGAFTTGLVENALGPNGLPVASAYGRTPGTPSGNISDIDPATNEIRWWSTASPYVTFEKSQTDSLPLNVTSGFFPDGYSDDSTFFRTVHWQASFDEIGSGSETFSLGSDDDAYVFLDGNLVVDDGGIHGLNFVPNVVTGISAGSHTLDLFFADRNNVESGIEFDSSITLDPTTTVPEPSSLALIGLAAPGLLALRRRKR